MVEVEGLIEILETAMEQEQAEKESLEAEEAAQSSPGEAPAGSLVLR